MRLTRFQFVSSIAMLGCAATWAVTSRAQSGTWTTSPGATSSVSSERTAAAPNETPKSPHVERQVRELLAPAGAVPAAPAKNKKQVIDLRGRIASNDNTVRAAQTPQSSTNTPRDPNWVDQAIPRALFDEANVAPRGNQSITGTNRISNPRELAAPVGSSANSPAVNNPPTKQSTAESAPAGLALTPSEDSASSSPTKEQTRPATATADPTATAPKPNRTLPEIVGLDDRQISRDSTEASTERDSVPSGAKWIVLDPSQETVPAQEVAPRNGTASPAAKIPTPNSNAQPLPDPKSTTPTHPPSPTNSRPGSAVEQAIPDWIYGQAGARPPTAGPALTLPFSSAAPGGARDSVQSPEPVAADPNSLHSVLEPPSPSDQSATTGAAAGSGASKIGDAASKEKDKNKYLPSFMPGEYLHPEIDPGSCPVPYSPLDFGSQAVGPQGSTFDPAGAAYAYRGKFSVPTQRPLVELWRPLYTPGIYAPAPTWFGVTNPMKPHFMVYGDARTALGVNRNANGQSNVWGNVLNLDMDLQLTSTERIHAFVSPLNRATKASGLSFNDDVKFIDGTNFNFNTLFFEGDAGALLGGAQRRYPPFDLPFTFGLIPLVYQNGIWANDAVLGAAMAIPSKHSSLLNWSNFDATLFWATDNVTTDAFRGRDSAADFFGTAWFIDAYEGYIEADYAFVNDNTGTGLGYHNLSFAFTRRYLSKVSNSVRYIINTGQGDLAKVNRTADGTLLLIENSFITAYPNTVVPYLNMFYGQGRPQSLARAGVAGGILTNTGINFETDGITGYPTLDPTGHNTLGLASGINLLGSQFSHQLVLEFAMLKALGSAPFRNAAGDQYGFGIRYQKPLSNNLIFRTDQMVGLREHDTNLNGSRFEFRWKF